MKSSKLAVASLLSTLSLAPLAVAYAESNVVNQQYATTSCAGKCAPTTCEGKCAPTTCAGKCAGACVPQQ